MDWYMDGNSEFDIVHLGYSSFYFYSTLASASLSLHQLHFPCHLLIIGKLETS